MAKRKETKKCYTFKVSISDGGNRYAFGSKVELTAKEAKKYDSYILLTEDFQRIYPNVDIAKHSDCGCSK